MPCRFDRFSSKSSAEATIYRVPFLLKKYARASCSIICVRHESMHLLFVSTRMITGALCVASIQAQRSSHAQHLPCVPIAMCPHSLLFVGPSKLSAVGLIGKRRTMVEAFVDGLRKWTVVGTNCQSTAERSEVRRLAEAGLGFPHAFACRTQFPFGVTSENQERNNYSDHPAGNMCARARG